MKEWNVVATARQSHFPEAVKLLKQFGRVEKTHYYDVLVMEVDDPREFLERLHERLADEPAIGECLGHVSPCTETFIFQSLGEFEEHARKAVQQYIPDLCGKRFHIRMRRRGFKGRLHATDEEQFLDGVLLEALEEADTPGEITFDDPDAIVALETVDTKAGLAVWMREDLERYPLLKLD